MTNSAKKQNALFAVFEAGEVFPVDVLSERSGICHHETIKTAGYLVNRRYISRLESGVFALTELGIDAQTKGVVIKSGPMAVVDDFKTKGFVIKRGGKPIGNRAGFSKKKYVRLIHALWASCAKLDVIDDGSKKALRSFVAAQTEKRGARIDDPDFLTYDQASPIIETLKSMEKRGKKKGWWLWHFPFFNWKPPANWSAWKCSGHNC